MKRNKHISVAVVGLLLLALPTALSATAGTGVITTELGRGNAADGIAISTQAGAVVTLREITIAPGGSTGWHSHDGPLIAVVKSGVLSRWLSDCSFVATPAGSAFVEPGGSQHGHVGYNAGAEPVVLLVTYLSPENAALSRDVTDAPRCAFFH